MNQTTIGIALVVLLGVGAGTAIVVQQRAANTATVNSNAQVNADVSSGAAMSDDATTPRSLRALLIANVPVRCTFDDHTNDIDTDGTIYVANGKFRADVSSTIDGKVQEGHMLSDGTTTYVWSPALEQGFKMGTQAMFEGSADADGKTAIDPNKDIDYSCSPWLPDANLFVAPSTVTFVELGAMMQKIPGAGSMMDDGSAGAGASMSAQCKACDSLADDQSKATCLQALGC